MIKYLIEAMNENMLELDLTVKEILTDYSKIGSSRKTSGQVNLFHYRVSLVSQLFTADVQANLLEIDTTVLSSRIQRGRDIEYKRSA